MATSAQTRRLDLIDPRDSGPERTAQNPPKAHSEAGALQ